MRLLQAINWPFLEPVDEASLGIHDYYDVIKTPMDLKTMKQKMDARQYASLAEVREDFLLLFSNCFLYNPEGQPVNKCGKDLKKLFDTKWAAMPAEPLHDEPATPSSTASAHHSPVATGSTSGRAAVEGGSLASPPSSQMKSPKGGGGSAALSSTSPAALISNLKSINDDDQIEIILLQVQEEQARIQDNLQQLQTHVKELLFLKWAL